jgi:ABC-type Fe3+ transport system permease subunit
MNTKQPITRTAVTFAALTVAGISVAASAQVIQNAFAQTIMVAVGSAIFGAGLAFFLVRISMR